MLRADVIRYEFISINFAVACVTPTIRNEFNRRAAWLHKVFRVMRQVVAVNKRHFAKSTDLAFGAVTELRKRALQYWDLLRTGLERVLGNRLRTYILAVCMLLMILVGGAWLAANALAYQHFSNYLGSVSLGSSDRLRELRAQVGSTLMRLDGLDVTQAHCSAEIYEQEVALIREFRFVFEAAVRLDSGVVCSSFGTEQASKVLPGIDDDGYYAPGNGRQYWFQAGRGVSVDSGMLVIAQGSSYMWLNKGILLDALKMPRGMSLDLIDENTLQSRFSNDVGVLNLTHRPALGQLEFGQGHLYLAYPVKWSGMFALVSLPSSAYHQVWLGFFTALLLGSLATLFMLYHTCRSIYVRYFSMQARLRTALSESQLKVHYQPIVDMKTGAWKGAETLLRWSVDGKPVSPAVFIPLAEQNGMITNLTRWVCRQVAEEHATYLWACKELYITINLAAADVADPSFPDFVKALFAEYEIPASRIVFEVTEGSLLDKEVASAQLQRLRDIGHRIAVDDFGTGYSSLSYLEELPVDILKIDRSFLTPDKMHSTDGLWWHVASMARSLNLMVVAEGVETSEQVDPLLSAGVTLAQGWLYSKDLSIDQLAKRFFALHIDPALSAAI